MDVVAKGGGCVREREREINEIAMVFVSPVVHV